MNVYAYFPVLGQSGWEKLCRNFVLALDKLGVTVQLHLKESWNNERVRLDFEDESRLARMVRQVVPQNHCDAVLFQQAPDDKMLSVPWVKDPAQKKYCLSLFETDRCPVPWLDRLNRMTETWVFSEFNRAGWSASGVTNARVMPFAVDTDLFHPGVSPIKVAGQRGFTFITNGDYTERKNFEGLIEAFVTEFTAEEDVCLIVKAHYGGFIRRYQEDVLRRLRADVERFNKANPPRILLIGDKIPEHEMPRFYATGDCFVLPTRGEGLGLPFAEALACGVPVIAPRWGGQMQFLNDENAYLVDCVTKQIDDMEYVKRCIHSLNHHWAYPSIPTLRQLMRFAYTFREEAKAKGRVGRAQMEQRTWQDVALWAIGRILGKPDAEVDLQDSVAVEVGR